MARGSARPSASPTWSEGEELAVDVDVDISSHDFIEYCGSQGSDHLSSVAVADVDGDGEPGVLVGMLRGDEGTSPCSDRSSAGLVAWYPGADLDGDHTIDQFDAALMIVGTGDPIYLGQGLTAGDLDGDGLADMVLGAPGDGGYGAVYLVSGADAVEAIAEDDTGGGDTGAEDTGAEDTGATDNRNHRHRGHRHRGHRHRRPSLRAGRRAARR